MTQQARQILWDLDDQDKDVQFLIQDNDTKFTHVFDAAFGSDGISIIRTPYQAPNANAFAER